MHSIIFPKGSYSTQRITLDYFAFTLLRSLIFPGRKHYRMKVLFPENAVLRETEFRERNSLKLQSFLHSTFDDRYRFLVIIVECNARIQHVLPFLLFFTRRVDPCLESCEPEQRAGVTWKELPPRINGGEALSR